MEYISEEFSKDCKQKCTCKEYEKNHQLCPVCDYDKYERAKKAFEGAFESLTHN